MKEKTSKRQRSKLKRRKVNVNILRGIATKLRATTELLKAGETPHATIVNDFEAVTQQLEKVVEE